MSSPEERIEELRLEAAQADARAMSKKYGGRISLMSGGVWLVSGAFVTDCLLHISGEAERISEAKQGMLIALGGLVGAFAVLRKGYDQGGTHLLELYQSRIEAKKANELRAGANKLASWVNGPQPLRAHEESEIDQFKACLDDIVDAYDI